MMKHTLQGTTQILNGKQLQALTKKRMLFQYQLNHWDVTLLIYVALVPHICLKWKKIAKNNLLFDNYYSSVPSTSLSYLAINKSIPVISTRPDQTLSLPYREKLYAENDLTQAFKRNGYNTKFISSTDLVFEMDKSIAVMKRPLSSRNLGKTFSSV